MSVLDDIDRMLRNESSDDENAVYNQTIRLPYAGTRVLASSKSSMDDGYNVYRHTPTPLKYIQSSRIPSAAYKLDPSSPPYKPLVDNQSPGTTYKASTEAHGLSYTYTSTPQVSKWTSQLHGIQDMQQSQSATAGDSGHRYTTRKGGSRPSGLFKKKSPFFAAGSGGSGGDAQSTSQHLVKSPKESQSVSCSSQIEMYSNHQRLEQLGHRFHNTPAPAKTRSPLQAQNISQHAIPIPYQQQMHQFHRQGCQTQAQAVSRISTSRDHASSPIDHQSVTGKEKSCSTTLPVTVLPERSRRIFKFNHFNEVQTKAFDVMYNSAANAVISSPTGSGKTVLFELAILKALKDNSNEIKILYLAPTKALCMERAKDWESRFSALDVPVGVLTGDTPLNEADKVRSATIIISTPEKWDLLSRRWRDYQKLFGLIKLLLVDEIHILKKSRGSALEVVVTRMKRLCENLRIVALSATISNIDDISNWIKLSNRENLAAKTLVFDDSYRPVKLEKIVLAYKHDSDNAFLFDKVLNSELNEVISTHSRGKPVLIFCPTRISAIGTAKYVAGFSGTSYAGSALKLKEKDLAILVKSGVAFHHAGLSYQDRRVIEEAFLTGKLRILCSTSTLAVGVNLPAYMVIVKGTQCWTGEFSEYSETDVLQMIGRAGRPQFEKEGKAIIMTTLSEKARYHRLANGTEKVESSLSSTLPENLAAEIALGTIHTNEEAVKWLESTFFYVRFMLNPSHYIEVPQSLTGSRALSSRLYDYCQIILDSLLKEEIISWQPPSTYLITDYGKAMARHYVSFSTMKHIIKSPIGGSGAEMLALLSQSSEFSEVRMKHQEKRLYKEINASASIKYPIKTQDFTNADKVSILIQFELGGLEFPVYNGAMKLHTTLLTDKFQVFRQADRIVRCMIDVFSFKRDSKSLRSCLRLARCINGKCWEHSPMELRQLDGIGLAYVKKFAKHNIESLQHAKSLSSQQLEHILGLKWGAGRKYTQSLSSLPNVSASIAVSNLTVDPIGSNIKLNFKVSVTVKNSKISQTWQRKYVTLNITTELSTGVLIDFRRISVSKFNELEPKCFSVSASATDKEQAIKVTITTENIAGVGFETSVKVSECIDDWKSMSLPEEGIALDQQLSRLFEGVKTQASPDRTDLLDSTLNSKTLSDASQTSDMSDLDVDEVFRVAEAKAKNFDHQERISLPKKQTISHILQPDDSRLPSLDGRATKGERKRLKNGNYECAHFCKNRWGCRHLCCKNGVPAKSLKRLGSSHTDIPRKISAPGFLQHHMSTEELNSKRKAELSPGEVKQVLVDIPEFDFEHDGKENKARIKRVKSAYIDSVSASGDGLFTKKRRIQECSTVNPPSALSQVPEIPTSMQSDLSTSSNEATIPRKKKLVLSSRNNILDSSDRGIFEGNSDDEFSELTIPESAKVKLDKTEARGPTHRSAIFRIYDDTDSTRLQTHAPTRDLLLDSTGAYSEQPDRPRSSSPGSAVRNTNNSMHLGLGHCEPEAIKSKTTTVKEGVDLEADCMQKSIGTGVTVE